MIARGTGVAVFRNFGILCLDIFGSRITDFWNRKLSFSVSWQVGVETFIRCFRFLRNIRPPLSTMYDLGLWSLLMNLDSVVHCFSLSSLTLTRSPGWSAGSSLVPFLLSKDSLYLFFCFNIRLLDCCMVWKLWLWDFGHCWDSSSYLSSNDQLWWCLSSSCDRDCTAIRARNRSSCSRIRLEIRTPLSAELFARWWCGLHLVFSALNSSNKAAFNCVPLSLTSSSGIPHRENTDFSFWITARLVISTRLNISMKIE